MMTHDSGRNMSDCNGKLEDKPNKENWLGVRDSIDDKDLTGDGEDQERTRLLTEDVGEENGNESVKCDINDVLDVLSAWTSHFSVVS